MNDFASVPIDEFEKPREKPYRFPRVNTDTIMATYFAPIKWVVPGYVPEGLSILAGRQKLGKTWLALDWAIAVTCGGAAMGSILCDQGDVLYVDLENGQRRIQDRINILFPSAHTRPNLSRLQWVNEAPNLNKGFMAGWMSGLGPWRHHVWSLLTSFKGSSRTPNPVKTHTKVTMKRWRTCSAGPPSGALE